MLFRRAILIDILGIITNMCGDASQFSEFLDPGLLVIFWYYSEGKQLFQPRTFNHQHSTFLRISDLVADRNGTFMYPRMMYSD